MAGILIDYTRFVEVQRRRARIGAEVSQANQTPALRTRLAFVDDAVEANDPEGTVVEVKITHGTVDVR